MADSNLTYHLPDEEVGPTQRRLREFNRERREETVAPEAQIAELKEQLADYEDIMAHLDADREFCMDAIKDAVEFMNRVVPSLRARVGFIDTVRRQHKSLSRRSNPKNKAAHQDPVHPDISTSLRNAINPFKRVGGE